MIILIGKQLAHEVIECKPALHQHPRLSILRKYNIVLLQRRSRTHACALLALASYVEAQAALSLRVEHDQVHDGYRQHIFIHLQCKLVRRRRERRVYNVSVRAHGAVGRDRGVGVWELEGEIRGELAVHCTWKSDPGCLQLESRNEIEGICALTLLSRASGRRNAILPRGGYCASVVEAKIGTANVRDESRSASL